MNTILIFNLRNGKEIKVTFEGDIKKNKQMLFDIVESVNKDKFIFVESNVVEDFYIIKTDDIVNINVDVDYRINNYNVKSPLD